MTSCRHGATSNKRRGVLLRSFIGISHDGGDAMIDDATFIEYMDRVNALRESNMVTAGLWNGYRNGLRRLRFGEGFGTEAQHVLRMTIPLDDPDPSRGEYGRGYRAGYSGEDPACLAGQDA